MPEIPAAEVAAEDRARTEVLGSRFRLPPKGMSGLVHAMLLLVVSAAAAFVISPALYTQQIPDLGPEDLGKPFHSASPSGFKAGRDYQIVNQAATEQRRQEARNSVRPVYDYNPAVVGDLRQAVHEAFAPMREVVAQVEREAAAEKSSAARASAEESSAALRKKRKAEPLPSFKDELLATRLLGERRSFEHRLFPIEDEDFQALVAARFSQKIELAASSLIERAYHAPVATLRDELVQSGGQGITVRTLGSGGELVSSVAPPIVNDVQETKAELDRFASIPGYFLPDSPPALRRAVLRLAKRQIRPNLTINIAETEARRNQASDGVKDAVIQIRKGQKVISDGELIDESHLAILKTVRAHTDRLDFLEVQFGGAGLVALLVAAAYVFHRAAFKRFHPTRKDALLLGSLLIAMLGLIRLAVTVADAVHDKYSRIPAEALYYSIPVAAGAMLVRFLLNQELALFFAIVLSSLAGAMLGNSLPFGVYALVGSLIAADRVGRAKDRTGILKAGLMVGAVNIPTVLFFALAEGKGLSTDLAITAAFSFVGNSLAIPIIVLALTPPVEAIFGYASDIKLLELANLNHPALKELIVQAPGTYHHSIVVGRLVEAAAEAIGANSLLARSCAYYHDIGKGQNPLYFGENQKGENRHDALAPAMSAVIIKRHVTDGVEMARQYQLPKLVAEAIPQHHGTRLVGYFHQKALKEQEGKENPQPVDENLYRYAGPKPQFSEAALVMIADAVEATSKTLPDPSRSNLQLLVHKWINLLFSEGQLDDCDLTLRDLNLIAESFVRTLEGIYHARPEYPTGSMANPRSGEGPRPVAIASAGKVSEGKVGRQA
jgi:putative nucleotidyltransferase with HDIG domain